MNKDFEDAFKIMEEAFPPHEMRTYEGQKALLVENEYRLVVKRIKGGEMVAFITAWEFDDFSFIEHLAINRKFRGLGIGTKFLKDFIKTHTNPVILEVEPGVTEIAKRRINFYESIGFYLNDYPHKQPALRKDTEPCELKIMSYPKPLNKEEFLSIRKTMFTRIYKV